MDVNNWIVIFLVIWLQNEKVNCENIDDSSHYDNSIYEDDGSSVETDEPESNIDLELNRDYLSTIPQAYRIIYPVQIRRNIALDTLSTADPRAKLKGSHYSHTTFAFPVFGKVVKVRLNLNKELLSKGVKQKVTLDETTSVIEESTQESCYYQGHVRKVPKSFAAFTTCLNGLSGVLYMNNVSYIVEPLEARTDGNKTIQAHVIYKTVQAPRKTCGNDRGNWNPYQELHMGEFLRRLKIMKTNKSDQELYSRSKYIDLALVMDHAMYENFNWTYSTTWTYAIQLANIVDLYLQQYNIHINLIFTEVWNLQDQIHLTDNVKETLQRFMLYRQKTMNKLKPDIAIFISGEEFAKNEVGMSVPDSICTDRSIAVVQDNDITDRLQVASAVTHMIAHTLGINHDHQHDCECDDPFGCIMNHNPMGDMRTHPFHLNSCSKKDLNGSIKAGLGMCLYKDNIEASFSQQCGNGEVERGEECDCGNDKNCDTLDPCCDPATCLLRSWATCRFGDCCYNCTVLPRNHMCRAPSTECDVPEFCDGASGSCPRNVLVQDGQPCRDHTSYCYHGFCNTYEGQCRTIWGQDAIASVDTCYEKFNPTGNFNGHCGFNSTLNSYIKCTDENIRCGLLHCAEGNSRPRFGKNNTFSHTYIVSDGKEFECKILTDVLETVSPLGLVKDGTKCEDNKMCIHGKCTPIATIVKETCPVGLNGQVCSGNGLCKSNAECFCFPKYTGISCSIQTTVATTPSTSTITEWLNATNTTLNPAVLYVVTSTIAVHDTTAAFLLTDNITTLWLIIVLACVAGGACLLLCCCFLCYRRRSPKRQKKNVNKSKLFGKSDFMAEREKVISFGNLPSYRADKIKKALRKSMGGQSETGSEHSAATDRGSREINIPENFPNLPSPPEKGILKKHSKAGRSLDNLRKNNAKPAAESYELQPLRNTFEPPKHRWLHSYGLFGRHTPRVLSEGDLSPGREETTVALIQQQECDSDSNNIENLIEKKSNNKIEGFYEGLRDSYYKASSDNNLQEGHYDQLNREQTDNNRDGNEDSCSENECFDAENCEICSQCSGSSSIEKCLSNSDLDLSDLDNLDPEDSRDVQTQTDELVSPLSIKTLVLEDDNKDSLEGTKNRINKLKNINDLLKQIDEQFNSVLKQTQHSDNNSPASSDDYRCSQTEADRQYGDNYYKQSDFEEPTSSRSSYVSSNGGQGNAPSTSKGGGGQGRNCSRVTSSNISSPDPLPSPSCIISPISGEKNPLLGDFSPDEDCSYPNIQRHSTPIGKADIPHDRPSRPPNETKPTSSQNTVDNRKTSPSRIPVFKAGKKQTSPERKPLLKQNPEKSVNNNPTRLKSPTRTNLSRQFSDEKTPVEYPSPWKKIVPQHTTSTPISSPQSPRNRTDLVTAVPYRGGKITTPSSIPSSPSKSKTKPELTGINPLTRSMSAVEARSSSKSKPTGHNVAYNRQLTDPTLDGYPFKANGSGDLHSLSEGYHSDKPDDLQSSSNNSTSSSKPKMDDSVIIREIPQKPTNLNLRSPIRNSKYISSPEDVNV